MCTLHRPSHTVTCQSSIAIAPRCWHLKMSCLCCGLSNHTGQQEEWGIQLPCQHLSVNSNNNIIPHPELFSFWLRSTDQNLAQSGCPATCNEHLCLAMTNGPSRVVTSPASKTAFKISDMPSLFSYTAKAAAQLACLGFMNLLKQMQDRTV